MTIVELIVHWDDEQIPVRGRAAEILALILDRAVEINDMEVGQLQFDWGSGHLTGFLRKHLGHHQDKAAS